MRLKSRQRTAIVFLVIFSAENVFSQPLCVALFADNIKDAKPAAAPSLFSSVLKFDLKTRKNILLANENLQKKKNQLTSDLESARKATNDQLQSLLAALPKGLKAEVEAAVSQYISRIENAESSEAVEVYRHKADLYLKHINEESQKIVGTFNQTKSVGLHSLKSASRFQTTDRTAAFEAELKKFSTVKTSDAALALSNTIIESLKKQIQEFQVKETQRKQAELRYDMKSEAQTEQVLNNYSEIASKIDEKMILTPERAKQLAVMINQSPEMRKFIYDEMQFIRRAQNTKQQNLRASLQERLRNNETILNQYEASFKVDPTSAKDAIKFKISLRGLLKSAFSADNAHRIHENLNQLKLTHEIREKIISDALKNANLLATLLPLTMKTPKFPVEPKKPQAPQKPTLYTKSDFRGKDPSRIKAMVRDMKEDIRKFSAAAQQYPKDIQAFTDKKNEYKVQLKQVTQARERIQRAQENFYAYLVLNRPEIFSSAAKKPAIQQVQKQMQAQIRTNLKRLSKTQYNSFVSSHPQYARYATETRTQVQTTDSMGFFDTWMMYSLTQNPIWFISPTVARVQLIMDVMSYGTIRHDHEDRSSYLNGIGSSIGVDTRIDYSSDRNVETYYQSLAAENAVDIKSASRLTEQTLGLDTQALEADVSALGRPETDVLLFNEPVEGLQMDGAADAMLDQLQRTTIDQSTEQALREADESQRLAQVAEEEAARAHNEAQEAIDLAQQEAQAAEREAAEAQREAEQAQRDAEAAQQEAEQAEREAKEAQEAAEQAQRDAEQAQRDAEQAQRDADDAAAAAANEAAAAAAADNQSSWSSDDNN